MKTLKNKPLDIFSKPGKKKETQKQKIIIDYREKNSLVPARLKKEGFDLEFKELKIADYMVKDIAIERKTVNDFVSSMLNKRLLKQLEELQEYKSKLLLIEGIAEQELYSDFKEGVNANAIRGFLISILLKHKIPVLFTKNPKDTAKFISVIAKKREKEISLKTKKKILNKKEQLQFILEGFPGIGPKTAQKLLERFNSLKEIINASEAELKEVLGKKSESFKKIIEDNYK